MIYYFFSPSFVDTLSNFLLLCPWKVQQTQQLNNPGIIEISIFSIHVYNLGGQAVTFVEECKLRFGVYINQSFSPFIVILYRLSALISRQHPFLFSTENSVCILTCYLCCMLLFSWILFSFSHYLLPFVKPENTYIPFTHCKFATDLRTTQQADACTSRSVLYIEILKKICVCLWLERMSANLANAHKWTQSQEKLSTHTPQGKHIHITSSGWVSVSLV